MYDLLIQNGFLIDGSGSPGIHADLAVQQGKIAQIRRNIRQPAAQVINADGLVVAPGFIDSHSHDDLILACDPAFAHKLEQGITTQIVGMCGFSNAPISDQFLQEGVRTNQNLMHTGLAPDNTHLRLFSEYMDYVQQMCTGTNILGYVGHNTVRIAVMGYENSPPTARQLEKMQYYVEDAMRAGALGISLGLFYAPGAYSQTQEAIALCQVAAQYGGSLSLHMRHEDERMLQSVQEVLEIVHATGIRAVISHHKAAGKPALCWGMSRQSLALIEQANAEGYDVFLDQYPYTASSTVLSSLLPQSMHALGQQALLEGFADPGRRAAFCREMMQGTTPEEYFFGVMVGASESHPELTGAFLLEAAKQRGVHPCELLFDLLLGDRMGTSCINWRMDEEDVRRIMAYPRTMIGTDGLYYPGCTNCHPRAMGSFPRVLGHYVRQEGVLTLEDAIRKMTGMPSMLYGLQGKGLLRVGMDADITLFDPATVEDGADFQHCFAPNRGIHTVLVGGQVAVSGGKYQGGLFGRVLRSV